MGRKYNPVNNIITRIDELDKIEQNEITEHILGLSASDAISNSKEISIEMMSDYIDEIEEQYHNWGKIIGLRTGYWILDKMTMGLAPGELIIVAGATSNGKTMLAMNIAANVLKSNKAILFVTLEMTKTEIGIRFKNIIGQDYINHASRVFWQKNDEMNWKSIDGLIQKAVKEAGVDLVIIDHLHYFSRELQNVSEDLGRITKEFKKNAIRHNIPIILISHTRKGEGNTTKTSINDLRGSSYIAQDADIVLMVHKDKQFKDDIIVTLEKNRNRHGVDIGSDYHFKQQGLKILDPGVNDKFIL